MYDELKNKPELRKSITHITLSITNYNCSYN